MTTNTDQFTDPVAVFSAEETHALEVLHDRYQTDHDFFSPRERARLHFLRWLVHTGRAGMHFDAVSGQSASDTEPK